MDGSAADGEHAFFSPRVFVIVVRPQRRAGAQDDPPPEKDGQEGWRQEIREEIQEEIGKEVCEERRKEVCPESFRQEVS